MMRCPPRHRPRCRQYVLPNHPAAPFPRPAAQTLEVIFASEDVYRLSQATLRVEGFDKSIPKLVRALAVLYAAGDGAAR